MSIPLVYHPDYSYPFPAEHRFPMEKFALLQTYLAQRGLLQAGRSYRPGAAALAVLEQAHCPAYLQRFINNQQTPAELKRMGLPWSQALVRRTLISPNGTLLTARLALECGIACHLAGGTHHAHYDHAAGFCILNDLAVTALTLLRQAKIQRLLIFDCDVHQGDGTARMLAHEPRAFTCSLHCSANYPSEKARSDWDIELPPGMGDNAYLQQVFAALDQLLAQWRPDLVLYDAGVDVYTKDPLGLLNISQEAIRARDNGVLRRCKAAKVPVATVIGGGYDTDRQALARRHAVVIEEAFAVFCGDY
jgi:acetoin utilization deacetylase AcuC-like enzyme